HSASACTSQDKLCFNCRQPGHQSKACTKPRGVLNRTCGGCGERGHVADNCSKRDSWSCKNCTESGHGHWECSKPKGYRRMRCHLCRQLGHTSTNCGNRSVSLEIFATYLLPYSRHLFRNHVRLQTVAHRKEVLGT
ncbi:hypothetical protein C8T65DRAFT_584740, partial [Cerioporus squamosus]